MRGRALYWTMALLVCSLAAPMASAQQTPVFIFAGQSNMVGYATDNTALTASQQSQLSLQPSHRLWAGQQDQPVSWVNMPTATQVNTPDPSGSDPRSFPISSGHGFGPELGASLTLSNGLFGQTVGAVKYAVNSTGLRADDSDVDWSPSTGELYSQMVSRTNTATAALPNSKISGFFWMQGERDATDQDRADLYQYNLLNLINTVRGSGPNGFNDPNLPIVLGQIANDPGFGDYTDTIRRAQANIAKLVPNVKLVSTDDLEHADNSVPFGALHLSTKGTFDLGVRMGQAYLAIKSPPPSAPASMNKIVNGSFEDYAVSHWTGFPGSFGSGVTTPSDAMPGWSPVGKGFTLVNQAVSSDWGSGTAAPSDGAQFMSLENGVFNPGGAGGISQAFSTTNGQFYNVYFDYSAISRGEGESSSFSYDVGGSATTKVISTGSTPTFVMVPWQSASFSFTASASTTTLRFKPLDTPNGDFFGAAIDNVKVFEGSVWKGSSGGNWSTNSNWTTTSANPNSTGANANFIWTNSSPMTINLNNNRTLGSIRFDSPNAYTISGSSSITFDQTGSANASVLVARGSHTISSAMRLNDNLDVDTASGSGLTLSGQISDDSTHRMLTKFGAGTLVLSNSNNTYRNPTRVVGGTLSLSNGGTTNNINASPIITIYSGATLNTTGLSGGGLTLAANQHLHANGTVRGGLTATASGTAIMPGGENSVGQTVFNGAGNITLGTNATLEMHVGGTGASIGDAGINYDQVVVDGSKSFVTGGATLRLFAMPGIITGQAYTIVSTANGATVNFSTVLKNVSGPLTEGPQYKDGALRYTIDYDSAFVKVTFQSVPEPGSLSLAGMMSCLLLKRRKRAS